MEKNLLEEKIEKCRQEIQKSLDKHGCGIVAVPKVTIKEDGNLNITEDIKIITLMKPKKSKYIN